MIPKEKSPDIDIDVDTMSMSVNESTTGPAAGKDWVEGREEDGELMMGEPRVGGDVDVEDEPGVFTDNEVCFPVEPIDVFICSCLIVLLPPDW